MGLLLIGVLCGVFCSILVSLDGTSIWELLLAYTFGGAFGLIGSAIIVVFLEPSSVTKTRSPLSRE